MPGGNQPTGGWMSGHRRTGVARAFAGVLAACAAALLSALPARAQTLVPDPSPVVTIVQGLVDSVSASTEEIAAPVTAVLPAEIVHVLNGAVISPATPPADAAPPTPPPLPAAPVEPEAISGRRIVPTGTTAVLEFARSSTALLLLALGAAVFLSFEAVLARRNPRVTSAPVDRREAELEFR